MGKLIIGGTEEMDKEKTKFNQKGITLIALIITIIAIIIGIVSYIFLFKDNDSFQNEEQQNLNENEIQNNQQETSTENDIQNYIREMPTETINSTFTTITN